MSVFGLPVYGLTGGIGSGKSTVARMLRTQGIPVVDADQLARSVVAPGTEGLASIVEHFGRDFILPDGNLARAKLADLVFHDESARRGLNRIVHPRVAARAAEMLRQLADDGATHAVYEVPLLFENDLDGMFDATLLVAASEPTQLARIMRRDGLDAVGARARIAAQMPLAEKRRRATHCLENDGSTTETALELRRVWRALTGDDVPFTVPDASSTSGI